VPKVWRAAGNIRPTERHRNSFNNTTLMSDKAIQSSLPSFFGVRAVCSAALEAMHGLLTIKHRGRTHDGERELLSVLLPPDACRRLTPGRWTHWKLRPNSQYSFFTGNKIAPVRIRIIQRLMAMFSTLVVEIKVQRKPHQDYKPNARICILLFSSLRETAPSI
jgi:hypothetical protein